MIDFVSDICKANGEVRAEIRQNAIHRIQESKKKALLPDEYNEDLITILTGELPIVRALEIATMSPSYECKSIRIYEQPMRFDKKVQAALIRVNEYIMKNIYGAEKVEYECWNCGILSDTGKSYLQKFLEENNDIKLEYVEPNYNIIRSLDAVTVMGSTERYGYINKVMGFAVGPRTPKKG